MSLVQSVRMADGQETSSRQAVETADFVTSAFVTDVSRYITHSWSEKWEQLMREYLSENSWSEKNWSEKWEKLIGEYGEQLIRDSWHKFRHGNGRQPDFITEFPWENFYIQMIVMVRSRPYEMNTDPGSQNTILVGFQSTLPCVDFIFVLLNIKLICSNLVTCLNSLHSR